MDLNTITVSDFKALFKRDFPYLPVYDNAALYNTGGVVYYPTTQLFYKCTQNGTTGIVPTDTDNWELTTGSVDDYVSDDDIERAFQEAKILFNQGLWGDDDQIKLGYLYLTAHYLVNDLRATAAGLAGTGYFPVSSRSVGNVSESYFIPDAYKDNPAFAFLSQSAYGMKYLSLVGPRLIGNVVAVFGRTQP